MDLSELNDRSLDNDEVSTDPFKKLSHKIGKGREVKLELHSTNYSTSQDEFTSPTIINNKVDDLEIEKDGSKKLREGKTYQTKEKSRGRNNYDSESDFESSQNYVAVTNNIKSLRKKGYFDKAKKAKLGFQI